MGWPAISMAADSPLAATVTAFAKRAAAVAVDSIYCVETKELRMTKRKFVWIGVVALLGAALWGLWTLGRLPECKNHAGMDIRPVVEAAARQNGLSPALVMAVIWKESRMKSNCVGKAGELGLMQVMPIAAEEWRRVHPGQKVDSRTLREPEDNVKIGCWYLAWCGAHWKKRSCPEILQLAEYNAGYGHVKKWIPKDPTKPVTLDMLPESVQSYVTQVLEQKVHFEKLMAETAQSDEWLLKN